ncbi:MAG: response regulator transcription factor [Nitrososphaerales archaeon]
MPIHLIYVICVLFSTHMRALVVEDNPGWQEILAEILSDMGLEVDVAANSMAASTHIAASTHRMAVVDLSLRADDEGNQEGLHILEALRQYDPACAAVLLTGFATVEIAVAALKEYGAWTCLRKEAFRRAEFKDVVGQILSQPAAEDPLASLTPREREVMMLLVQGLPNKGIAHRMVISENTVKRYLKSIFEKLDVDSRAAAVAKVLSGPGA